MRASPHALSSLLVVALSVCLAGSVRADSHTELRERPAGAAKIDAAADTPANPAPAAAQQVIELTNRERIKAGLPALKRQKNLEEAATWMARDLAEHRYFDHRDSGRREMPSRLTDFRYSPYHALGENIAMGQRTPQEVVDGWMNSPGHRANILSSNFSEIGVGYVPPSTNNAYGYWVEDFGSRFDTCPVVINNDTASTASSRVKLSVHGEQWVEQIRYSNDGAHWTTWEDFRPLRDWSLESGCGKRTVYIELRRAARVERLQAAITVDNPPSEIATTANARAR